MGQITGVAIDYIYIFVERRIDPWVKLCADITSAILHHATHNACAGGVGDDWPVGKISRQAPGTDEKLVRFGKRINGLCRRSVATKRTTPVKFLFSIGKNGKARTDCVR